MMDIVGKTYFHGTTAGQFDSFVPRFRKGEQLGFGVHFAESRDFALRYATDKMTARKGKSPALYTVQIDADRYLNSMSIVSEGSAEFSLALKLGGKKLYLSKTEEGVPCLWMQHALDATTPQRAQKMLLDAGYDSVIYEARIGTQGINARIIDKSPSIVVLSGSNIKILDVDLNPLGIETTHHQNIDNATLHRAQQAGSFIKQLKRKVTPR